MQNKLARAIVLTVAWFTMGPVLAGDLSGRYISVEESSLTLRLQESADGSVSGTLADPVEWLAVNGRRTADGFAGTLGPIGDTVPCTAVVNGARLILTVEGDEVVFLRNDAGKSDPATVASAGQRNVIINGQRLSDAELAQIEQTYQIRVPDADYWYDPVLGAWGARGGQTLGFTLPGLALGGALRPDASGGGTSVFVNGRALHPLDLIALQQITGPILPGRYFITADGLAGYEGGPPQWNLGAMAAASQRGGSSSWQTKFTSGISDGETIGIFLPNGGIVSTGP